MKNEFSLIQRKNGGASSLTRLYIYALSAVAILSISGQILIQKTLYEKSNDFYIINMAGRQRMLSQRICKDILILESDIHDNKKYYLSELDKTFISWKKFQHGLHYGDKNLGLKGDNSKKIMQMFNEEEPYFNDMAKNISLILSLYKTGIESVSIKVPVKKILDSENQFLNRMIDIVNQYEKESMQKDRFVKKTEIILISLTLLVLFLEGFFVFRPAAVRIRKNFEDLIFSENMTREVNRMLRISQESLKDMNEHLEIKIKDRTMEILLKNKELEEKNEQLARMNKDLDNFVYTASHDLKGPISNIEGLVEEISPELCKETGLPEMRLSLIKESIAKFNKVLKELSDTGKARVEASGKSLSISFKEVLDEIEFSMKGMIETSGTIISYDFSSAPQINYAQKNLRSILYNLISNAIKFHFPDRKPYIRVLTEKKENYIVLIVSDNGIGIKQDDIPKLFSMYTRLTDSVEGTGVGLTMIKRIIENNGGKVEVKSKFGVGSTFCVYFRI